jgi:type IV fimbrial biogenesis protein FimT
MMIVMSVLAIVLIVAVPGFSAVVHKNRVQSVSTQLFMSLNMARSEAVKRRRDVRVCPSADNRSCRDDGNWDDGWLIFEDANGSGTPQLAEIIRVIENPRTSIAVVASTSVSEYLQFRPTGAALGNAGSTGAYRVCHAGSIVPGAIVRISAAGRVEHDGSAQEACAGDG